MSEETLQSITLSKELSDAHHESIIGRDEELDILHRVFKEVVSVDTTAKKTSVILIDGPTGVGKTTLATSLRHQVMQHDAGFFVVKFDQLTQMMDASAAVSNGIDSILSDVYKDGRGADLLREINLDLVDGHFEEEEFNRLIREFPTLAKIVDQSGSSQFRIGAELKSCFRHEQELMLSSDAAMGMLKESLRLIRRAVGRIYPITIIVFDDLHWADESMLGVFSALTDDSVSPTTIFVGTYRTDETTSALRRMLDGLSRLNTISLSEIHLQGIAKKAFTVFVQTMMDQSIDPLSSVMVDALFRRTSGYVFYARELLFALRSRSATWDSASMEADFGTSLEDLLVYKLSQLRSDVLQMLRTASCLGSKIDEVILGLLLQVKTEQVEALLSEAKDYDIITRRPIGETNRFVWYFLHDAFKEALHNILPQSEQSQLHYEIGLRLLSTANENEDRDLLLIAASQLCLGAAAIPGRAGDVKVATVCLKACTYAANSSGFWTARDFLLRGIKVLEKRSSWSDEYALFLQLYSAAAELSYRTGYLEEVHAFADIVLQRAICQQDKYRAHAVKVYAFGGSFQFEKAIDYGLGVLHSTLGIRVKRKAPFLHTLLCIKLLRRRIARMGFAALLNLKTMHDAELLTAMHLLNVLFLYCYLDDDSAAATVATLMVDLTLRYGGGPFSFVGFGVLATILCSPPFLDIDFGVQLGEAAVTLFEKFSSRTWHARMITIHTVGTVLMKNPISTTFAPLEKAYRIGLCYGDIEMAMACGSTLCFNKLEYLQLSEVEQIMLQHREQLLLYNQHGLATLLRPLLQFVQVLLSHDASDFDGEDEVLGMEHVEESVKPNARIHIFTQTHYMVLYFLFGRVDAAYGALRKLPKNQPMGANDIAYSMWCEALVCIQMAKKATGYRKRTKLRKRALRHLRTLSKLALHNPHLFLCRQFLVEAEYYSDKPQAHSKFVAAIAQAHHSKSLLMIAVTNERAARFYLQRNELREATNCFAEALNYYEKWGANSKAKHLRHELSSIFPE